MGFWSGVHDFFLGKDPEEYKADTAASTEGGAYGSTSNFQDLAGSAIGRTAPMSSAALAGQAYTAGPAQLNSSDYGQVRNQQLGLTGLLNAASRGEGPSGAGLAAQAQRDASLSQAAALQAGRRGRSAVAGSRMGTLSAQMGNQQASQNEAIGRANEMATARGQLGANLSSLAGQDINVAGQNAGFRQQSGMFNAGQQQQMNQFNAGLQQQTNLANQNAQLQQTGLNQSLALGANNALQNQAQAEMAARMQQEQMAFGNLDPGTGGYLGTALGLAGAGIGAAFGGPAGAQLGYTAGSGIGNGVASAYAKGGFVDGPTVALVGEAGPEMVVPLSPGHEEMQSKALRILSQMKGHEPMPKMADGGIVGGAALPLTQQPVQLMGIGQRVVPYNRKAAAQNQANASIQALINALITHELENDQKAKDAAKKAEEESKANRTESAKLMTDAYDSGIRSPYVSNPGPFRNPYAYLMRKPS